MAKHLEPEPTEVPGWTFFTNHGHVLICIVRDNEIRLSEIARTVGIGERAVHSIVADLVEAGYVVRTKAGRRNRYEVRLDRPLRHPHESEYVVGDVILPFTGDRGADVTDDD